MSTSQKPLNFLWVGHTNLKQARRFGPSTLQGSHTGEIPLNRGDLSSIDLQGIIKPHLQQGFIPKTFSKKFLIDISIVVLIWWNTTNLI